MNSYNLLYLKRESHCNFIHFYDFIYHLYLSNIYPQLTLQAYIMKNKTNLIIFYLHNSIFMYSISLKGTVPYPVEPEGKSGAILDTFLFLTSHIQLLTTLLLISVLLSITITSTICVVCLQTNYLLAEITAMDS